MSDQTLPQNPPAPPLTDALLTRAKEAVAAVIAIIVIICLIAMIWKAFGLMNKDDSEVAFRQVKDLLLFINPLVGVVIGYYFNKVSTEARAESAEATAKAASTTAQQATEARQKAEGDAEKSQQEAETARETIRELIPAAEAVLAQPRPALSRTEGDEPAEAVVGPRLDLQRALRRARSIV